tara:strand:+ start:456 stop:740 length:285 start_codon:yes stop_codon:yes gene_type:complete
MKYSGTKFYHYQDCNKNKCSTCTQSGINWWVFDANVNDREIYKTLAELGYIEDLDRGIHDDNDWDCSGQCLSYMPTIKRTKSRALVTQSWAYDI